MMDDEGYMLSERAARQLAALVKTAFQLSVKQERAKNATLVPFQRVGITTTAITGRSGKTPGSGTVKPYYDDGTTLVEDTVLGTQTIKNWTGSGVASNMWVKFTIIDGFLYLDGLDCSGVTP